MARALLIWTVCFPALLIGCGPKAPAPEVRVIPKPAPAAPKTVQKIDLVVGKGPAVSKGDSVVVRYAGTLMDGTPFDSNLAAEKDALVVELGSGQVIQGWEEGLIGMKKGGRRQLIIPAALGYGSQGSGPIPANSDLKFVIELIHLGKKGEEDLVNFNDIKVGTGPAIDADSQIVLSFEARIVGGKSVDQGKRIATSVDRLQPVGFKAGIEGMKAGGSRRITVPPALARIYGGPPQGVGQFMEFEVTLDRVVKQ